MYRLSRSRVRPIEAVLPVMILCSLPAYQAALLAVPQIALELDLSCCGQLLLRLSGLCGALPIVSSKNFSSSLARHMPSYCCCCSCSNTYVLVIAAINLWGCHLSHLVDKSINLYLKEKHNFLKKYYVIYLLRDIYF